MTTEDKTQNPDPTKSDPGNPPGDPKPDGTPVPEADKPADAGGDKDPTKPEGDADPDGKAAAEAVEKARGEANKKAADEAISQWKDAAKADPEIGGTKFDTSVVDMDAGIKAVGSEALAKLLDATGLKHHPEFMRAFAKVGKMAKEGTFHQGNPPKGKPKSTAEVFYDNTK